MRISYNPEQLFDSTGKPLSAGRVTLYVHDSDVLLPVYTLSGDVYSVAQNPVILDDEGRMNTLWFDATVADIRVEQNVDGVYTQVDTYQYGFRVPEVTNDTVVYGMEGLSSTNPELGTVTVVGYNNGHDCGPRCFVWDPTCTTAEDGGAIVASSTSENGRWILLSESRYMPSNWYGIIPGTDEANIGAFLSYPATVGQWGIHLPPVPRFLSGTYTTNGSMSATKTLAFDRGAKFTKLSLSCYNAEIDGPVTDYVCDFTFTVAQEVAESSWFRSVRKFWSCGACELHQSKDNFFEDDSITLSLGVAYKKITGTPVSMTGTGRLLLTDCQIAPRSLSTSWYVTFNTIAFSDRMFSGADWDFGVSGSVHHQNVDVNANAVSLSNIDNPNVYLLIMAANGQSSVNLEGRSVGTVAADMPFEAFVNGTIGEAHFSHDIYLEKITCYNLYMEDRRSALSAVDSNVVLAGSTCKSVTMRGGSLAVRADIDTYDTAVNLVDVQLDVSQGNISRNDPADHDAGQGTSLIGCTITGDGDIANNYIHVENCRINDADVWLFPQGTSILTGQFIGNTWNGTGCLRIVPGIDDTHSMDIYDVPVNQLVIKNNTFNTTLPGIKMPFWAQDMEHRFVKGVCSTVDVSGTTATWVYSWTYAGNSGNCPASYGSMRQDFNDSLRAQITFGSGVHDTVRFCGDLQNVFVLPVMFNDGGSTVDSEWVVADTAKACTPYKALATPFNTGYADRTASFPGTMYLPACALDKTLTNTMFDVYLGGSGAFIFAGAVPVPAVQ